MKMKEVIIFGERATMFQTVSNIRSRCRKSPCKVKDLKYE